MPLSTATSKLLDGASTLNGRLADLHQHLLQVLPDVDRIACALYNANDDTLKTFINSTRTGEAIEGYEYKLSDSGSLSDLARTGEFRVLDNIASAVHASNMHSKWLLKQGYQSSFTVPIYDQGSLLGFVFFDSMQAFAFTPTVQRDLVLYCSLISMSISNEMGAVRTMVESIRIARELTMMRDFETGKHLERMAQYSRLIAKYVAPRLHLSDEVVEHVYMFAPLHDIGKIGIPDYILLKPGKLTQDEQKIMDSHVELGVKLIERISGSGGATRLPDSSILMNIVKSHHEALDGSGYPQGLKGADVPIEARIVMVADIFDALTAERPYKSIWSTADALTELQSLAAAGKVDALCVEALVSNLDQILTIQHKYSDTVA